LAALIVALVVGSGPPAHVAAHSTKAGAIEITHPMTYESAPGARNAAVWMTLRNAGRAPDRLLSAHTPLAATTTIVGIAPARAARPGQGLAILPGERLEMSPSRIHLRLEDLKKTLGAWDTFPMTLVFKRAGRVTVEVMVEEETGTAAPASPAAAAPAAGTPAAGTPAPASGGLPVAPSTSSGPAPADGKAPEPAHRH
jgi:hypothetical protein